LLIGHTILEIGRIPGGIPKYGTEVPCALIFYSSLYMAGWFGGMKEDEFICSDE
jgi:hypothetical protein